MADLWRTTGQSERKKIFHFFCVTGCCVFCPLACFTHIIDLLLFFFFFFLFFSFFFPWNGFVIKATFRQRGPRLSPTSEQTTPWQPSLLSANTTIRIWFELNIFDSLSSFLILFLFVCFFCFFLFSSSCPQSFKWGMWACRSLSRGRTLHCGA